MTLIAPSILSANLLSLQAEIKALEKAGADRIHVDVMDGVFVPNLTFGPVLIKAIKGATTLPLDVHLMIDHPERSLDQYIQAGADILTIHAESCGHLDRAIDYIKSHKVKAGVALNPATHESALQYVADKLDQVLVMSVNPGFSGQHFLPSAINKIKAIKTMLAHSHNERCVISVDGGINEKTASQVISAGAECLVAGSFIFSAKDYDLAIQALKGLTSL